MDILYFSVTLMGDHFGPFLKQKYNNVVLPAEFVVPRLKIGPATGPTDTAMLYRTDKASR
jgi:hypothetical protein